MVTEAVLIVTYLVTAQPAASREIRLPTREICEPLAARYREQPGTIAVCVEVEAQRSMLLDVPIKRPPVGDFPLPDKTLR